MDFIDEQHIALFEIGQQRGEIAGLCNHRAGGRAETDAEFARHDLRQRGLAEARRADEQHMVERFLARARRLDEDREILARLFLPDKLAELQRAQRGFRSVFLAAFRCDNAGRIRHVMPRRYLFGSNSPIVTTPGALPFGTMTRAVAS